MKIISASILCSIGMILSAPGLGLDVNGLGNSLNGWNQQRVAAYTMDNRSCRTHMPTITGTPGGGIFVSMRVECVSRTGKATGSSLELEFDATGDLVAGQIRARIGGEQINTGRVTRAAAPVPSGGGEDAPDAGESGRTSGADLAAELFGALDKELARLAKVDAEGKKDVFGRLFRQDSPSADLATVLRHNMNLVLGYVR